MKTGKKISLLLFIFFISIILNNLSFLKKNKEEIISGYIKLVGSDPFSEVVLETKEKRHYYLPESFKKDYPDLIFKNVTIKGIVKLKTIETADKKYTIKKYLLEKIKVVEK